MSKRLIRWSIAMAVITGLVLGLSGKWTDPWLWTYVAVWAGLAGYAMLTIDEDLARERYHPPHGGADRGPLRAIQLAALAHLVAGPLDIGRWHLTDTVPASLRVAAMAGMTAGGALIFRSMRENRYFASVIRIQSDRGHRVVDSGPYSIVRHPGYAGMIVAIPLSGLALGSWMSAALGLAYAALILRRVRFEDAFLSEQLEGYADYAARVPSRLIPTVW